MKKQLMPACACLLLVALLFTWEPVRAGDDTSTVTYESSSKEHTVALPSYWKAEQGRDEEALFDFNIYIPADRELPNGRFTIYWIEGILIARAQPYFEKDYQLERFGSGRAEIGMIPLPYLAVYYKDDLSACVTIFIYRVINGRGFSIVAVFEEEPFRVVRDQIFEAAASFTSSLDPWPPDPAGYDLLMKDGFAILLSIC